MSYNPKVHPDREALAAVLKNHPKDKPVVMLNLLRYRDKAMSGTESGREAYQRYSQNVLPHLKKAKGRLLYKGKTTQFLSGDSENIPHEILLVQYPSVQHFLDMVMTEEYIKLSEDRTIALEFGGLIAFDTEYSDFG